jgi:hypothetical protein
MVEHEHADRLFACWIWILQVASKCLVRGLLIRDSGLPHDAASIALKTRARREWLEFSIPFFIKVGWIEIVDVEQDDFISNGSANTERPHGVHMASTHGRSVAYKKKEEEGSKSPASDFDHASHGGALGRARHSPRGHKIRIWRRPAPAPKVDPPPSPVTLAEAAEVDPQLRSEITNAVASMRKAVVESTKNKTK